MRKAVAKGSKFRIADFGLRISTHPPKVTRPGVGRNHIRISKFEIRNLLSGVL